MIKFKSHDVYIIESKLKAQGDFEGEKLTLKNKSKKEEGEFDIEVGGKFNLYNFNIDKGKVKSAKNLITLDNSEIKEGELKAKEDISIDGDILIDNSTLEANTSFKSGHLSLVNGSRLAVEETATVTRMVVGEGSTYHIKGAFNRDNMNEGSNMNANGQNGANEGLFRLFEEVIIS